MVYCYEKDFNYLKLELINFIKLLVNKQGYSSFIKYYFFTHFEYVYQDVVNWDDNKRRKYFTNKKPIFDPEYIHFLYSLENFKQDKEIYRCYLEIIFDIVDLILLGDLGSKSWGYGDDKEKKKVEVKRKDKDEIPKYIYNDSINQILLTYNTYTLKPIYND